MTATPIEGNVVHTMRRRGDSLRLKVFLGGEDRAIDVSDWSFLCQLLRWGWARGSEMTSTVIDAEKGVVEISLTGEETAAMPAGDYDWSLRCTDTKGDRRTVLFGKIRLKEATAP